LKVRVELLDVPAAEYVCLRASGIEFERFEVHVDLTADALRATHQLDREDSRASAKEHDSRLFPDEARYEGATGVEEDGGASQALLTSREAEDPSALQRVSGRTSQPMEVIVFQCYTVREAPGVRPCWVL
jgi:hypothetical protein